MLNRNSRIYVAGHRGLVGSAIWKEIGDKDIVMSSLWQPKHSNFVQLIHSGGMYGKMAGDIIIGGDLVITVPCA